MPTIKDSDTRERVLRWKLKGKSADWIATKIGVSRTVIYYHLDRLIDEGRIEPEQAKKTYKARKP